MTREQAINEILDGIEPDALVIASTGKIGRELFELRKKRGEPNDDFLMMGSMGCALSIGLGVALHTEKQVYVLDGDGAFLMKMGSLATCLGINPFPPYPLHNLHHIILNNDAHDSTGGQRTHFLAIKHWIPPTSKIVDVEKGCRSDLGRPTLTPQEIKEKFCAKVRA